MPLKFSAPLPPLDAEGLWLNGQPDITQLENKPIVIHFWATSCAFCLFSGSYLQEWSAGFSHFGLHIISVHVPRMEHERNVDIVQRAAQENGFCFPCALDNQHTLSSRFQIDGVVPHYFFFDKNHQMRSRATGERGARLVGSALTKYFNVTPK